MAERSDASRRTVQTILGRLPPTGSPMSDMRVKDVWRIIYVYQQVVLQL